MKSLIESAKEIPIQFGESYSFSIEVEHFTEIKEINPVPSNSIIYKTITGIGATHSEIVAERNSIIVLPHIAVVISKNEYYRQEHNTLAVYGETTDIEIYNYLISDAMSAKLLATPQGLKKIIRVMEAFGKEVDYKKLFFLLIDECHKLIQTANYRKDMVEVMEHFFDFERKAMISATPLNTSDIRFKEQGFKRIRIFPDYDYKQRIELIHADSLLNGLVNYFKKNTRDQYFIFFNSINGIKSIIEQLNISDDYMIFCSAESFNHLRLQKEYNSSWKTDGYKRFNFLTSSFFNGLDIILDCEPNILILTDNGVGEHTLLDPYADILQIIGRFRKKYKGHIPYNKITHINNAKHFTNPISQEEATKNVALTMNACELFSTFKHATGRTDLNPLFDQALTTFKPYSELRSIKWRIR